MSENWDSAGLTLEYCGFMIAIMVERCKVEMFQSNIQNSPVEVARILNSLPGGSNQEFNLDAEALHQGIHHFKRFVTSRGFLVIEMFSEKDRVQQYHDLKCHLKKGYNLKFPQFIHEDLRSMSEISDAIISSRDSMFKMYKIRKSTYLKASYIFMEMHSNIKNTQIEKAENFTSPPLLANKFKTRKNVETVSEKTKKKNAKRILDMIDETVGEQNVTMYLDFVNKLNNKRRKVGNENRMTNNENDNDMQLFTNAHMIANDFSVKEIIKTMKKKYNTTTNEEKYQIIKLIDAARNACDLILPDEIISNNEIVSITHKLMEETGLCNINKRAILRLHNNKGIILRKRGRKINKDFESELWANLMICSYEERNNEVSNFVVCYVYLT